MSTSVCLIITALTIVSALGFLSGREPGSKCRTLFLGKNSVLIKA